jgi:hypothetical protein
MNRFTPGGSSATELPPRIMLKAKKGLWHYRPMDFPYVEATVFPRIPFALVQTCGSWLSQVWRHYQRVGCVLLYRNVAAKDWETHVPPQTITDRSFLCDLTFRGFERPSRDHLLCGSFTSDSTDNGNDVMDSVPPFDGIHIVQHVQPSWLPSVLSFVRAISSSFRNRRSGWNPPQIPSGKLGASGYGLQAASRRYIAFLSIRCSERRYH